MPKLHEARTLDQAMSFQEQVQEVFKTTYQSCMHIDSPAEPSFARQMSSHKEGDKVFSIHASQLSSSHQVLLMTCQVLAVGHDSSTYQARALLDSVLSTSFVSKCLAQHLRLLHRKHSSKITGIGGGRMQLSSRGSVDLHIKSTHTNGRSMKLEALVLPKITSDVPSYIVAFDCKWKHLTDL